MKRLKLPTINGAAVPVTNFPPEPDERLHGAGMRAQPSPPLPPPPPQINAPVGPPPPVPDLPTTYAGYVELAKKVSKGSMTDKALIWVGLAQAEATNAQAEATNRVGVLLEQLLEFLGARDGSPDDNHETSRLSEAIADGIVMAATHEAEDPKAEK